MNANDIYAQLTKRPFVAWFDRTNDTICIVDRRDRDRLNLKENQQLPEEAITRVPLHAGEIFVQAVLNAVGDKGSVGSLLGAAVKVADGEARAWADLAESLRAEFVKRGAGIEKANQQNTVLTTELIRLRRIESFAQRMMDEGKGLTTADRTILEKLLNGPDDVEV